MARLMAGVFKPKYPVLGIDVAGQVEAVGSSVTEFQPGDAVFGAAKHGCFAEYVVSGEAALVKKPDSLTFEEAAAIPGAAVPALHAIRDHGQIKPGMRVLINGASGGVGTFAVQIARAYGAMVTGVCSERNLELVLSVGANQVVDYTEEDFIQDGQRYNLIFDVAATRSFSECKEALAPKGTFLTSAFSPLLAARGAISSIRGHKKLVPLPPKFPSHSDLLCLKQLSEAGELKSVIDRCYPLSELPLALRYLEKGHTRGKVVISL
jgi:NADPH:quinone reductase-like Zn-dependent oxidoreductase